MNKRKHSDMNMNQIKKNKLDSCRIKKNKLENCYINRQSNMSDNMIKLELEKLDQKINLIKLECMNKSDVLDKKIDLLFSEITKLNNAKNETGTYFIPYFI